MYSMKFTHLLNQTSRQFAGVFMGIVFSLATFTQLNAQVSVSIAKIDPTCADYTTGSATATASGGTGPYTYRWSTGTTGETLTNISAGTFSVTATDALNRTATASTTLVAPAALNMTFSFAAICTGGAVTATATGGTAPYTYNWGGGRIGATQTNLPSGDYNVIVTDAKGCAIYRYVRVPAPFVANLRIGELVCFGDCDAGIDALPQGGTAFTSPSGIQFFNYRWNTGATTPSIVGIPSGTYSVTITDANGCTSSATGTVANPPLVTLTTTIVAPTCAGGGNNGSATATATGGRPPFSYRWNNGQIGQTATGLSVGTYYVTATDAKGCNKSAPVVITSNAGFTLAIAQTNATCGGTNGSATANVTGGAAPIRYAWSTGATSQTINNLVAGNYTVTVTDNSGCSASATTTINAVGSLTISLTSTNAACGIANGTVTATPTSGTAPFRYLWSNGATTPTIATLAAGTYNVTVTDASGCTASGQKSIIQTSSFDVNLDVRNVVCNGQANGQITAMVMGGSAPYTYRWSNGGNVAVIANLGVATYTVTVTDQSGCTAVKSASITQPNAVTATIAATMTSCGTANGSATVTPGGGTPGYTYQWTNGSTSASISGLGAGAYTVTVTDSKGCTATAVTTITASTTLDASGTVTNVKCNGGNTGAIALVVSGATGTPTYTWNTGATTPSVSNLISGNYSVTINDSRNCSVVKQFSVGQPNALVASVSGTMTSCGTSNGTATASATGGTSGYSFKWNTTATTATITGLAAGTYTVTATDANLCTASSSITITVSTALSVNVTTTAVRCNGAATGSAVATPSGGVQPYTYSWSNGTTVVSTAANPSGLTGGSYLLTVNDAVGCSSSQVVNITQPSAISIFLDVRNAVCSSTSGSIANMTSVSGGTAPYTYLWSNGATTLTLNNLSTGTYTLTVTDANGCTKVSETTTVSFIAPPTVTLTPTNVLCNGGNTGAIVASATGGSGSYSYAWSNSATNSSITGLVAGTYTVTVTDSRNCTAIRLVTLSQPSAISISQVVTNATCVSTGSIAVTASGGTGTLTYLWSNGRTTSTITGLTAGNYALTVTDANGCTNSTTYTVTANISLNFSCSVSQTKNISSQGAADGEARVTTSNGVAPFIYNWSNAGNTQATQTAVFLRAGLSSVTVTDANGCTTICSITLTEPTCVQLTNAGTISGSQTFCNASELTGIFEATPATGGTGTIEYLWMYSDFTADFSAGGWNIIAGATGKDLPANLLPNITRQTNFIRCVRRSGCGLYIEGNVISKIPVVSITPTIDRFPCLNAVRTFTATDNGVGTTYQWLFQGANIATSFSRVVNVTFTSTGTKSVTLIIIKNGCTQSRTYQIEVTNCFAGFGSLFAFSVSATGSKDVHLNWATTGEQKTSSYVIEKSTDNVNFAPIGTVTSQNLPNNLYTFVDPKPKMGRAFYRIHQMSPIGEEVMMSKTEKVVIADKGQLLVTYPNPVGATLFVEALDAENTEGVIEIYNEIGSLVQTQQFTSNQIRYEINTNDLGKGNYVLKMRRSDGTISTTKISKF
jgi:hypothetical protein